MHRVQLQSAHGEDDIELSPGDGLDRQMREEGKVLQRVHCTLIPKLRSQGQHVFHPLLMEGHISIHLGPAYVK